MKFFGREEEIAELRRIREVAGCRLALALGGDAVSDDEGACARLPNSGDGLSR